MELHELFPDACYVSDQRAASSARHDDCRTQRKCRAAVCRPPAWDSSSCACRNLRLPLCVTSLSWCAVWLAHAPPGADIARCRLETRPVFLHVTIATGQSADGSDPARAGQLHQNDILVSPVLSCHAMPCHAMPWRAVFSSVLVPMCSGLCCCSCDVSPCSVLGWMWRA